MKRQLLLSTGFVLISGLAFTAMAQQTIEGAAVPADAPAVVEAPAVPVQVPAANAPAPAQAEVPAAAPVAPAPSTQDPVAAPGAPATVPPSSVAAPTAPDAAAAAAPTSGAADAPASAPEAGASAAPAPAVSPTLPVAHDMTPMGMYRQADWVVKSVMIMLAVACFVTWTVLFFKSIEIFLARGRARSAARVLLKSRTLDEATRELGKRRDPAAFMASAVSEEYRRSADVLVPAGADGIKERAVSIAGRVEVQASARLRRGMGILATVGSVSPFVGLFGTVWGIMNSFIGIAETQTTNLAVVAPGIAEALFATAIGLVAAIPAVVIYNHFTRGIAGYRQALGDANAAALRLLSRDIDFAIAKTGARAEV